jgi:hypothetical protein
LAFQLSEVSFHVAVLKNHRHVEEIKKVLGISRYKQAG